MELPNKGNSQCLTRFLRFAGKPPLNEEGNKMQGCRYHISDVSAIVPLGAAACTHDDPEATLNILERQTIYHRNCHRAHLPQQGDGGDGRVLSARPESSILLVL